MIYSSESKQDEIIGSIWFHDIYWPLRRLRGDFDFIEQTNWTPRAGLVYAEFFEKFSMSFFLEKRCDEAVEVKLVFEEVFRCLSELLWKCAESSTNFESF
jgi:hypothetical protein